MKMLTKVEMSFDDISIAWKRYMKAVRAKGARLKKTRSEMKVTKEEKEQIYRGGFPEAAARS